MLADEERNTLVEKEKSFQDAAFIGMGAERMKRKYEEKAGVAMQKKKQWQRVCLLLLLINTVVLFTSLFIDNRPLLFISVIIFVGIVLALILYKDPSSGLQEELLTLQQSAGGRQSEEAMSVRYQLEKMKRYVNYLSASLISYSSWNERMIKSFHRMRNGREKRSRRENKSMHIKRAICFLNFIRMHTYCRRLSVLKNAAIISGIRETRHAKIFII